MRIARKTALAMAVVAVLGAANPAKANPLLVVAVAGTVAVGVAVGIFGYGMLKKYEEAVKDEEDA